MSSLDNLKKTTRDEEIQYVFQNTLEEQDEPEQSEQYILGGGELPDNLQNVIYPVGSTAVLVNGEYFLAQIPEDQTQTMMLREEDEGFTQYFYEAPDGLVVDSDENISKDEDAEIVQLVEDETPDVAALTAAEENQNVIYYTATALEDEGSSTSNDLVLQQGNMVPGEAEEVPTTVDSIQDDEGNIYPFKCVKFEEHHLVNLEDIIGQQNTVFLQENEEDGEEIEQKAHPNIEFHQDGVHYTLIGSENYQFCTYSDDSSPVTAGDDMQIIGSDEHRYNTTTSSGPKFCTMTSRTAQQPIEKENRNPQPPTTTTTVTISPIGYTTQPQPIILPDTSKIFGRNVVTGQTITLDDYLEKLKKKPIDFPIREKYRKTRKKPDAVSEQIKTKSLSALLDKKISIGTTRNGKKLVGKIIKVGWKGADETKQNYTSRVVELHQSELRSTTSEAGLDQSQLSSATSQAELHQSELSSATSEMGLLPQEPEINSQPTTNVRFLTRINVQGTQILIVEDAPVVLQEENEDDSTQSQAQIEEIEEPQEKLQFVAHHNMIRQETEAVEDVNIIDDNRQENAVGGDDVTINADRQDNEAGDIIMNSDRQENEADDAITNDDHQEDNTNCLDQEQQQQQPHNTTAAPPIATDGVSITRDLSDRPAKILIERQRLSDECFELISKTLGGLMDMEQVCDQLERKNMVVKLIQKTHVEGTDSVDRNCLYLYGYMAKCGGEQQQEDDSSVINSEVGNTASGDGGTTPPAKWKFVPDLPVLAAILRGDLDAAPSVAKFSTVTNITISITYGRFDRRTVKVNWNPTVGNLCAMCARFFKSNQHLRTHMAASHTNYYRRRHGNARTSCQMVGGDHQAGVDLINTVTNSETYDEDDVNVCEICLKGFVDFGSLQEHCKIHVEEQQAGGGLFVCQHCHKSCLSQPHLVAHQSTCKTARQNGDVQQRPLQCSLCNTKYADLVSLKRHLLTHSNSNVMVTTATTALANHDRATVNLATVLKQSQTVLSRCKGSGKRFANVHFGGNSQQRRRCDVEQNFVCNVCSRTFSRHSNLMRHAEVHKGGGNLYKCNICYCSYNYISSLTRHIVDHHIKKNPQMRQ